MKYTREQYEAFYYLNKLFPRLQVLNGFQRDIILTIQKIDNSFVSNLKK